MTDDDNLARTESGSDWSTDNAGVTLDVDGEPVVPATEPLTEPLVVLLHGYGSGAFYPGWRDLPADGAVYIAPLGTLNSYGSRFWNASPACCDRDGTQPDDVARIGALIDQAKAANGLTRVVVIGNSNGGFMAERLACERPDVVAVVNKAGARAGCTPSHPVAYLIDHSEADPTIRWDGGSIFGLPAYQGVLGNPSTAERDGGCGELVLEQSGLDHDADVAGPDTDVLSNACVTLWREHASGHSFYPTQQWGADVWTWVTANRLAP